MKNYSPETTAFLNHIDSLKKQIDAMQPISKDQHDRIFQKLRLDWNYNSNSIEGNSLNYDETVTFLMEGLTAKGKPLKDHLDIKGHNKAIEFLLDMQRQETELTERDILSLHEMILVEPYQSKAHTSDGQETTKTIQLGQYKSSPNHVRTATGEIHYYATPEETPALMHDLILWYRENREKLHPLVLSALFHHRFVNIHPFDDVNGRMTHLLSNLLLMKAGLPPLVVRQDERCEYYGVLSQADAGVVEPLIQFFAERLIRSLDTYLRGARGEDISDPADLDKEIALFVVGFDEDDLAKVPLTAAVMQQVIIDSITPLLLEIIKYAAKLNDLFFESYIEFIMIDGEYAKNTSRFAMTPSEFASKMLGKDFELSKFVAGRYEKKNNHIVISHISMRDLKQIIEGFRSKKILLLNFMKLSTLYLEKASQREHLKKIIQKL
jgi:Fic family protein